MSLPNKTFISINQIFLKLAADRTPYKHVLYFRYIGRQGMSSSKSLQVSKIFHEETWEK